MATLPELLQRQADKQPSGIALQGPDSAFSYAQMMQAAAALAAAFACRFFFLFSLRRAIC